jgi:hypothetical protein
MYEHDRGSAHTQKPGKERRSELVAARAESSDDGSGDRTSDRAKHEQPGGADHE